MLNCSAMRKLTVLALVLFSVFSAAQDRPKVRAITAFVRITPANYDTKIADALKTLRSAKSAYEQHGYTVESIRITTNPFPEIVDSMSQADALVFLQKLDALSQREGFDPNIGPALMHDSDNPDTVELLEQVLCKTKNLESSIIVADQDGIHWKSIYAAADLIKYVSEHSEHSQGTFNFTATAMLAPYGPFFPGSYHTGLGGDFSIGLEGASVVQQVFANTTMAKATVQLTTALSKYAVECEGIAKDVAKSTGWTYRGLDPTPAPLADVSIGAAIETLTHAKFGSSGTMTAASIITQAVKAVPVQQIGYSGLMVPVLEDSRLAQRWSEGTFNVDDALAYSAVCGTGLDTIPLPGDVTSEQLAAMIGDMASLAWKWKKPLSARLQPVAGKKPGDKTEFNDPFLTNAVLQRLP
ncbi:MAG: DUF711 family protein [Terriglobales bacterium]